MVAVFALSNETTIWNASPDGEGPTVADQFKELASKWLVPGTPPIVFVLDSFCMFPSANTWTKHSLPVNKDLFDALGHQAKPTIVFKPYATQAAGAKALQRQGFVLEQDASGDNVYIFRVAIAEAYMDPDTATRRGRHHLGGWAFAKLITFACSHLCSLEHSMPRQVLTWGDSQATIPTDYYDQFVHMFRATPPKVTLAPHALYKLHECIRLCL